MCCSVINYPAGFLVCLLWYQLFSVFNYLLLAYHHLVIYCYFASVFGSIGAYLLLPHVASRINRFLDPVNSENYQVTRSLEAFESGGLYGKGPGEGLSKTILPDSHTDFIFAVAGEEFEQLYAL